MDEQVTIRGLDARGVSVTEISRQTGRDRKTVRAALRQVVPKPHGNTGKPRCSKLDPFRAYLLGRVKEGCLNSHVLLEEISERGYLGRISILKGFLAPLRQEVVRQREATERFETRPGQQAQVDWASFGHIWDWKEARWRRLYAFIFTLCYSRAQYVVFTTCCDMQHFLACHRLAFEALGIPQEVLYDNLKTAILGREQDGRVIFPGQFLDFSLYYGFTPRFCQPNRPRTKGKVERTVGYLRQNFWVRVAREVANKELGLTELNQRVSQWVEKVANERVHGTHGEVVGKRLVEEEPLLGKVWQRPPYDTDYHSLRRVGRDGRLSYRGRLYQVGLRDALSEVWVDESLEGQIGIRGKEGQALRVESICVESDRTESERDWLQARGTKEGTANLLEVVYADQPLVEERDLAVYEEVARAAGVS